MNRAKDQITFPAGIFGQVCVFIRLLVCICSYIFHLFEFVFAFVLCTCLFFVSLFYSYILIQYLLACVLSVCVFILGSVIDMLSTILGATDIILFVLVSLFSSWALHLLFCLFLML